jgi:hypothetical protein
VRPFVIEVVGLGRVFWGGRPGMRIFPVWGRSAYWLTGVVDDPQRFVWLVGCGWFGWPDDRASSSRWEVGPSVVVCGPARLVCLFGRSVGVGCLTGSPASFVGLVRRGYGLVPLVCYWLAHLVFVDRSIRVVR